MLTEKWPVLHYGPTVEYKDLSAWRLRIHGAVERERTFTFDEFRALPTVDIPCDIHCVTTWSRFDNTFTGVRLRDMMEVVGVREPARFVIFHCARGFTTSIPIDVARDDDVGLVYLHDGQELAPEHGYPLRALVPTRYFWKSAKWLEAVEFVERDQLGFWERNGYNNSADPWLEERYW